MYTDLIVLEFMTKPFSLRKKLGLYFAQLLSEIPI